VELRQRTEEARAALADLEARWRRLSAEQDRIRQNLEAAGNQTPQGQEYLRRMALLDEDIDTLNAAIIDAEEKARAAQSAFDAYLGGLSL
jgi:predicted  nucleic acid-binding Zn-ribbon protein